MDEHMNDETLKRLLGPAEPELLCDECFEKLDEYVELELQGAEADDRIPGMRAHLEGCPACRGLRQPGRARPPRIARR